MISAEARCCEDQPASSRCEASLPDNPQSAPNYHFGMLLGVDDFRTEQGFHVGRLRRHQRLLHGAGIVAGFAVTPEQQGTELKVGAGYGIDTRGRDLTLCNEQCLNLALWWAKHEKDEAFTDIKPGTPFHLDVVVCYASCLERPVPAIAEPCAGKSADIAHSRVLETVKLALVRSTAEPPPNPHDAIVNALHASLELREGTPRHRLSEALADAVAAASPCATARDPHGGDDDAACLALARLSVRVHRDETSSIIELGAIDLSVRRTLLPSSVLQALLLDALVPGPAAGAGPAIARDGASLAGNVLTLVFDQRLAASSAKKAAFSVSLFSAAAGWKQIAFADPLYDESDLEKPTVTLDLDAQVLGARLRVTVIGTGSSPLLSDSFVPAGALTADSDGRDHTTTLILQGG